MGFRSISKYIGLIKIGMKLVEQGTAWMEKVKAEDSPGGEEITTVEYLELIPILEEAIKDGLGLAVNVAIEPK